MKIAIIGTDSSHAVAYSERLIQKGHELFAYRGGSSIEMSVSRINRITQQLYHLGVGIVDSLNEIAEICDAYVITSVDATQHLPQFEVLASFQKPIFIDKPLAQNSKDALAIITFAEQQNIPLMSCSALRFADSVVGQKNESIDAVDVIAPLPMLEPFDYFYYGIHPLEMIIAMKKVPTQDVNVTWNDVQHFVSITFVDNTVSTIRGYLQQRQSFQFTAHCSERSTWHVIEHGDVHFYDRLIEKIEQFFVTKKNPVPLEETLRIIQLLEMISARAKATIDF